MCEYVISFVSQLFMGSSL